MNRSDMSAYRSEIVPSVQNINRQAWDDMWPFKSESWNFYRTQESAGIEGFDFSYLTIYDNDKLILVAPFFITDFSLHLAFKENGIGSRIVLSIQKIIPRFMVMRTLFCGGYASEEGIIGIHPNYKNETPLFFTFDQSITQYARKRKCKLVVIKDILDKTNASLSPLLRYGFSKSTAIPMMSLPVKAKNMEDYFASLSGETRKNLRRKIKKTKEAGDVQVEEITDIAPYIDDIHALYMNVHNKKSDANFAVLTKDFFLNFSRYIPDQTIYFMYWIDVEGQRKLIGFNLCLNHPEYLVDKFIGMDYTYAHRYNFYFISLLKNIEWCIIHNKKTYELNQGSTEVKKRFGAIEKPTWHLTKSTNPIFNAFSKFFLDRNRHDNKRPDPSHLYFPATCRCHPIRFDPVVKTNF